MSSQEPESASERLHLGDYLVEPGLNRLSRRNRSVILEPKVMKLLRCLASRPGETVRYQQIRADVWGKVHVVDGVLARAAYQLRRAIADLGPTGLEIETCRHVGYRLAIRPGRIGWPSVVGRSLVSPKFAWATALTVLCLHLLAQQTVPAVIGPEIASALGAAPPARSSDAAGVRAEPGSSRPVAQVLDAAAERKRAESATLLPTVRSGRAADGPQVHAGELNGVLLAEIADRRERLRVDVQARRAALIEDVASRSSWSRPVRVRQAPGAALRSTGERNVLVFADGRFQRVASGAVFTAPSPRPAPAAPPPPSAPSPDWPRSDPA